MVRPIDRQLIDGLSTAAGRSKRLRSHANWHDPEQDQVQRFFVHMLPGTYVRPHCHERQQRVETTVVIAGHLDLLLFDEHGQIRERLALGPEQGVYGVELGADEWHSFHVHRAATLFEVKQGPYVAELDKRFADWAPAESTPEAAAFVDWLSHAAPGERWPSTAPLTAD